MSDNFTIVVITGLSGAGKSTAANAMEDLGYYTIDGLPVPIINKFLDIFNEIGINKNRVALVIDTRSGDGKEAFSVITRLRNDFNAKVIFLTASDSVLIRRYQESRRKHPMAKDIALSVQIENELMKDIKGLSDLVLDTSSLNVHELTKEVTSYFTGKVSNMIVTITSFGFKNGIPIDSDMVFDVRFMKNPYFVDSMKHKTGLNKDVQDYVLGDDDSKQFVEKLKELATFMVVQYQKDKTSRAFLAISVGCTGGRHRSVTVAEVLSEYINSLPNVTSNIRHRDIEK
ncbi:RNase adapter RapZ [Deferribacterales bacterium RsTz2092]|nr:nucleotide-binding protein [Deferribacterales bacterium]